MEIAQAARGRGCLLRSVCAGDSSNARTPAMGGNKICRLGPSDHWGIRCRSHHDSPRLRELSGTRRLGAVHRRHSERNGIRASLARQSLESVTGAVESPKARIGNRWVLLAPKIASRSTPDILVPDFAGRVSALALFLAVPLVWWCCLRRVFPFVDGTAPCRDSGGGRLDWPRWRTGSGNGVRSSAAIRYVVAAGGWATAGRWEDSDRSYAEGAEQELIRVGIPEAQIIVATAAKGRRTTAHFRICRCRLASASVQRDPPQGVLMCSLWAFTRDEAVSFLPKFIGPTRNIGVVSWIPLTYRICAMVAVQRSCQRAAYGNRRLRSMKPCSTPVGLRTLPIKKYFKVIS